MNKRRPRTSRELMIWAIHKGETNAEIVARIRKAHPRSTVTAATVNYVRNEIRKNDRSVKSDRVVRKSR